MAKFNSRDFEGEEVIVGTSSNCKYEGTLLRYFDSNSSIILSDYEMYERNEKSKEWKKMGKGDSMLLQRYGYLSIRVKSASEDLKRWVHKIKSRKQELSPHERKKQASSNYR